MSCRDARRALDPYVDDELDPSHVLTLEQHLAGCHECTEQVALARSMKRAFRHLARAEVAPEALRARIVRSAEQAPPSLRDRIMRSMVLEKSLADATATAARVPRHGAQAQPAHGRPSWRSALPWAAAAAIAIGVGGGVRFAGDRGNSVNASMTHTPMLDDFLENHAHPLPPEEIDPVRIANVFSPIVGVPVRPIRFASSHRGTYRFAGARLMPVHDEAAATLFYDVGGTRVTVYIFDPQRISIHSSCCMVPKSMRVHDEEHTVYVGRHKGYALAVQETNGVGYAVSADLPEQDVMALAASLPSPSP
ncbi:MAG: hypothetical protein NVSMB1_20420 [Polyangiales bacterium]